MKHSTLAILILMGLKGGLGCKEKENNWADWFSSRLLGIRTSTHKWTSIAKIQDFLSSIIFQVWKSSEVWMTAKGVHALS